MKKLATLILLAFSLTAFAGVEQTGISISGIVSSASAIVGSYPYQGELQRAVLQPVGGATNSTITLLDFDGTTLTNQAVTTAATSTWSFASLAHGGFYIKAANLLKSGIVTNITGPTTNIVAAVLQIIPGFTLTNQAGYFTNFVYSTPAYTNVTAGYTKLTNDFVSYIFTSIVNNVTNSWNASSNKLVSVTTAAVTNIVASTIITNTPLVYSNTISTVAAITNTIWPAVTNITAAVTNVVAPGYNIIFTDTR